MLFLVLALAGCAGVAPVPGGSDSVNASYYPSPDDFKAKVGQLQPGMGEGHVLMLLGRRPEELRQLNRNEILSALYGANTMQVMDSISEREETTAFMRQLYGYQLKYRDVEREHGFVNPLRIRTEEDGFDYTVNLIFKNGLLLEKPDLSGGVVHERSSSTFFDYLNPGSLMGRIP
ncbi:MAG: hypothetical protein EBQ96_02100 [Proteobacteria bacterium]|nr:hypothetical protein [Pseudomonadota bacterium]